MFVKFTLASATIFSTLLFVFSANASNDAQEQAPAKKSLSQKVSRETHKAADKIDEKGPALEEKAKKELKRGEKNVKNDSKKAEKKLKEAGKKAEKKVKKKIKKIF